MAESTKNEFHTTKTIHRSDVNYESGVLHIDEAESEILHTRLKNIYGIEAADEHIHELKRILKVYYSYKTEECKFNDINIDTNSRFTQEDIILITYGDIIKGKEKSSLKTLARFCDTYLEGAINTLHILPFFPYSSDKGFSVTDFTAVDPKVGTWEDIADLEQRYQLMFDGVFNHVSAKSRWFEEFLNGNERYKDYFTSYKTPEDLSPVDRQMIFRPRTSDILTRFYSIEGPVYVWSTFSPDQIDLNFKNPMVLFRVIEILFLYIRKGADIIRLDAVTFLWSEPGTSCIHLEETHEIVRLFRDIFKIVAPGATIITETNVPHEENISYFGNGHDEAQMVYNFALPPLVINTFYTQDSTEISNWAKTLDTGSDETTFFNFLDSHDGIGLMAVKNMLSEDQINFIVDRAKEHGAMISYKTGKSGKDEPYEMNVTWYSALNKKDADDGEDRAFHVKRFTASRSIALVIQGVPGIYLHSMIGTRNDTEKVKHTKTNRDINRTILKYDDVMDDLEDPFSRSSRINRELGRLIKLRTKISAFHPNARQDVLDISKEIFSVFRVSREKDQHVIAITNITNKPQTIEINLCDLGIEDLCESQTWYDVVSEMSWMVLNKKIFLTLNAYDVVWLIPTDEVKNNIKDIDVL